MLSFINDEPRIKLLVNLLDFSNFDEIALDLDDNEVAEAFRCKAEKGVNIFDSWLFSS